MRKLLMAMLVFCAAGQALGQEEPPAFVESLQKATWELVPEIYYYTYEEPGPDIKDTGTFFGLNGAVTWRDWVPASPKKSVPDEKWMGRFEGRFAFGQVDYDGYYMDGTPVSVDGIDDYVMEFRLLVGPDFPKQTRMDTLYAGIGYRYLYDDFQYSRESTYLYVPIGLKTTGNLKGNWSVDSTVEFDILLWGQQVSGLGELGYVDIENTQDSGYGLRGSVRFQKHGRKTDFIFEPFVRYWNIDQSDVVNGIYEPQNETLEIGIKFGWLF